jgi:DNA-binding transcriptional LysR family regulator
MKESPQSRAAELTVQQIQFFCEVFDRESYAEAARQLGMTAPSLWSQVQLLERRYGVILFEKTGRRVTCTADARRLRELYRPVLNGLESTFEIVRPDGDHPQAITMVTGMRMALEELPAAVATFHKQYPKVALRWQHADNMVAQEMVEQGDADLAVMLDTAAEHRSSCLQFKTVYRIEYLAIFPARHGLAKKATLRLGDLLSEPLVIGHPETFIRRALDVAIHQSNFTSPIQVAVETSNSAITIGCVRQGMGVGIIAGKANGRLLSGLRSRPLHSILGDARVIVAWKRGAILRQPVLDLIASIEAC